MPMNVQRSSCREIKRVRPPALRRSWLFVGGADDAELSKASGSGADVVILELEDFTAPGMRPVARAKAAELFDAWRAVGLIAAVRINPLETEDGLIDIEAVRMLSCFPRWRNRIRLNAWMPACLAWSEILAFRTDRLNWSPILSRRAA